MRVAVERELRIANADTGAIVQRTTWSTGDPAISPDGQRVALVLRSATKPSRVVIWKTAPEPDTGRARRDSLLLKRDPEDVAARSIYPPPKKPLATLRSAGGGPYESPRFLRDGRVLLWRRTARGDGSLRVGSLRLGSCPSFRSTNHARSFPSRSRPNARRTLGGRDAVSPRMVRRRRAST